MKKTVIILGTALAFLSNDLKAFDLLKNSKLENIYVFNREFPLHVAISKGDIVTVKKLIEYGADVNRIAKDMSPLMIAAFYNKVEIIEVLLEHGADSSVKNEKGFTALNYAEFSKSFESAALLKKSGK